MDFIVDLLNNIYKLVMNILKNAGVNVEGWSEELIPTDDDAE